MAAPTVVGASTVANWTAGLVGGVSITADFPAGVLAGDLVVGFPFARLAAVTIDTAALYTRVSGDNDTTTNLTAEIQAKIAGSSEPAPTFTAGPVTPQPAGAVVVVVRGWSGDIADLVVSAPNAGASSAIPFPDATAPEADCLVLRLFVNSDDNSRPVPPAVAPGEPPDAPAGHSPVFWELTVIGSDANAGAYSETAGPGSVGAATVTVSGGDSYLAYTVVIPPAAAGGPVTVPVGQAQETDTATAIGRAKRRAVGQATETDTATAVARRKARQVGMATATETARPITARRSRTVAVGRAQQADTATAITRRKVLLVGQAVETATAGPITPPGSSIVPRPFTGIVARPAAESVLRPNAGTVTRPASGTVTRPNTGIVTRP